MTNDEPLMGIDFEYLWKYVAGQSPMAGSSMHGVAHWRRVERNGLLLATRTGADTDVIRLFAIFHDSCRLDEGEDLEHGERGAEYARSLRGTAYELCDGQFELLHHACTWHTNALHHEDPTIGSCWDADRLDLGRAGVIPDAKFMSTAFGREIADYGSIQPFLIG